MCTSMARESLKEFTGTAHDNTPPQTPLPESNCSLYPQKGDAGFYMQAAAVVSGDDTDENTDGIM